MFTLKVELENFSPVNFENIEASGITIAENVKNSIILYNKAIESLKSNSEDIAIIELKKAISLNPHFYEAMNLLGLCYAYINELGRAEEMFEKVMSGEHNSIQAMEYIKRLNSGIEPYSGKNSKLGKNSKIKQGKRSQNTNSKPTNTLIKTPNNNTNTSSPTKETGVIRRIQKVSLNKLVLMMCIVCFALGAFLVYISGLSASDKGEALNEDATLTSTEKTKTTDVTKEQVDQLKLDLNDAKSELSVSNEIANSLKITNQLLQAENHMIKGKTFDAANILISMKDVVLNEEDKNLYDSLSAEAFPKAAKASFDEGFKAYNAKKYQDSLKNLQSVQYFKSDYKDMDKVFYYIGKCYVALNDARNAIAAFQNVVDNYPNSKYTKYSSYKIKELTQQP